MGLWEKFINLFQHDTMRYITYFLPKERIDQSMDDSPVHEGEAYCQLWLSEMYLSHDWEWGTGRYPVVHSATRYQYGDTLVTIPSVTEPELLKQLDKQHLNRVVQRNSQLTPLFPFNQGTVALEAGMFSMVTNEPIKRFIKSMESLSKLLAISEFSTIVNLAGPIYNSIESLLDVGDYRLELGYYDTFVPADDGFASNMLRPGYFVTILADDTQVDPGRLCIVNGELHEGNPGSAKEFLANHKRFEGHSYMLFRLAVRKSRDWNQVASINKLVVQAQTELMKRRKEQVNEYLLPDIKIEVLKSPDVVEKDRNPMIERIVDNLRGHGLQGAPREVAIQSLHAIMQRPRPPYDPVLEAELAELRKTLALPIQKNK